MGNPLVARMQGFGTTIFAQMSELALSTSAINLGQGLPDSDGPRVMLDAAVDAINSGLNQYPPGIGVPELRIAIALAGGVRPPRCCGFLTSPLTRPPCGRHSPRGPAWSC